MKSASFLQQDRHQAALTVLQAHPQLLVVEPHQHVLIAWLVSTRLRAPLWDASVAPPARLPWQEGELLLRARAASLESTLLLVPLWDAKIVKPAQVPFPPPLAKEQVAHCVATVQSENILQAMVLAAKFAHLARAFTLLL